MGTYSCASIVVNEIHFVIKRPQQILGLLLAIARLQLLHRGILLRGAGEPRQNREVEILDKLVVGPSSRDVVDLDAPVRFNLRAIAQSLGRRIEDLVIIVLDRPRHERLIAEIRETGARIRLIGDGDLSAGISAAVIGSGVHAVMGIGGAPEGVITAAAMRCLGGEIYARLVVDKPEHEKRCQQMGITDPKRIYRSKDLASGQNIVFAATGVTDGTLMKGVRFFGDGIRTTSLVMQTHPHRIRFIDSIHEGWGQREDSILEKRKAERRRTSDFRLALCPPPTGVGISVLSSLSPSWALPAPLW